MPGGTPGASRRQHSEAVTDTANRYQACSCFFFLTRHPETSFHFPFIHHFLITSYVPGTEKVPRIERALHSEEATLPKGQRLPWQSRPLPSPCRLFQQHQDSPEVLQGKPEVAQHWTMALLQTAASHIAPITVRDTGQRLSKHMLTAVSAESAGSEGTWPLV